MKWEYAFETGTLKQISERVNTLGLTGWEAVGFAANVGGDRFTVLLKRPLQE